jgi:acylphosphatase
MRAEITVQGMVQGVGYRFFVNRQANTYKLNGYVQNLPDGNVLVVVEGDHGLIADFIDELRVGPRSSRVTAVNVDWIDEPDEFKTFEVRF